MPIRNVISQLHIKFPLTNHQLQNREENNTPTGQWPAITPCYKSERWWKTVSTFIKQIGPATQYMTNTLRWQIPSGVSLLIDLPPCHPYRDRSVRTSDKCSWVFLLWWTLHSFHTAIGTGIGLAEQQVTNALGCFYSDGLSVMSSLHNYVRMAPETLQLWVEVTKHPGVFSSPTMVSHTCILVTRCQSNGLLKHLYFACVLSDHRASCPT